MRSLIIEDDPRIQRDLAEALLAAGFLVDTESDGNAAWFRGGTESYDLIILDLGLPGRDGLEILRHWRAEGVETPILILTARGSWSERVDGIDAGADDYLPKPFRMEELVARARALVRRAAGRGGDEITLGRLVLNLRTMSVAVDGRPVDLGPLEYRLVAFLAMHRDRTISPGQLLEHLYGDADSRDANALEALLTRLRRKIGADMIKTRKGFGYQISQT